MQTRNGDLRVEPRFQTFKCERVSSWVVQEARVVLDHVLWVTIDTFPSEGEVYKQYPELGTAKE